MEANTGVSVGTAEEFDDWERRFRQMPWQMTLDGGIVIAKPDSRPTAQAEVYEPPQGMRTLFGF